MNKKKKKHPSKKKTWLQKNRSWQRLKTEWCELDYTNKLIIIIGGLVLFELILTVFFYPWLSNEEVKNFGFSAAFQSILGSITGYIIGGMNRSGVNKPKNLPQPKVEDLPLVPGSHDTEEDCLLDARTIHEARYIQSSIIAGMCISCILILFVATALKCTYYVEGMIQLRDLISTSIGFLITTVPPKKK
ncbi:MAG: hypothetical protein FWF59_11315 [Turicibacter sp.]|nr:hypothetical protein [Turicibacter sp.]